MSNIDSEILNNRKNSLMSMIAQHKNKLAELEMELEDIKKVEVLIG